MFNNENKKLKEVFKLNKKIKKIIELLSCGDFDIICCDCGEKMEILHDSFELFFVSGFHLHCKKCEKKSIEVRF